MENGSEGRRKKEEGHGAQGARDRVAACAEVEKGPRDISLPHPSTDKVAHVAPEGYFSSFFHLSSSASTTDPLCHPLHHATTFRVLFPSSYHTPRVHRSFVTMTSRRSSVSPSRQQIGENFESFVILFGRWKDPTRRSYGTFRIARNFLFYDEERFYSKSYHRYVPKVDSSRTSNDEISRWS